MISIVLLALAMITTTDCLSYVPGSATVAGKLVRKTFPGPPNYEGIATGDQEETYYFLTLTRPACVSAGDDTDGLEPAIDRLQEIQLVLPDRAAYDRMQPYLEKEVRCQGNLFSAISGHHHTPALLDDADCEPVSRKPDHAARDRS